MEKVNFVNMLLLTVPETILNIYFAFHLLGESKHLPFKDFEKERKSNLLKLSIVVLLISFFTEIVPMFTSDLSYKSIVSSVFAVSLFALVYRIKILKSICLTLAFIALLISIEGPYMSLVVAFIFGDLQRLYDCNSFVRFLYSLPIRTLQAVAILTVWNMAYVINATKFFNLNKFKLVGTFSFLMLIETTVFYNFLKSIPVASIPVLVFNYSGVLACGIFNFFFFEFYMSTINKMVRYNIGNNEKKERIRND